MPFFVLQVNPQGQVLGDLGCMSDLDAKPCEADLEAHGFCRGETNPLAMMGAALDRYLPGCNAMRANEIYVFESSVIR